jgi:Uma2 family endonuclease
MLRCHAPFDAAQGALSEVGRRIQERFMANAARLVTADELERMPEDSYRYELVRGRLIRMSPVAPRHGEITMTLGSLLWQHVRAHRLGRVWTEVGFRLFSTPDTVLAPDVAFVREDRLPPPDATGFYRGAPDLAIEVLSPDDRAGETRDKVNDYLTAGTPMVIIVHPAERQLTVYQPGKRRVLCAEADTLDLDPIVSGFTLPIASLFE